MPERADNGWRSQPIHWAGHARRARVALSFETDA
jgi:hypothetical protein